MSARHANASLIAVFVILIAMAGILYLFSENKRLIPSKENAVIQTNSIHAEIKK